MAAAQVVRRYRWRMARSRLGDVPAAIPVARSPTRPCHRPAWCCYGTRWWGKQGWPIAGACETSHPPDHLNPDWEPATEPALEGDRACGAVQGGGVAGEW